MSLRKILPAHLPASYSNLKTMIKLSPLACKFEWYSSVFDLQLARSWSCWNSFGDSLSHWVAIWKRKCEMKIYFDCSDTKKKCELNGIKEFACCRRKISSAEKLSFVDFIQNSIQNENLKFVNKFLNWIQKSNHNIWQSCFVYVNFPYLSKQL